MWGDQDSSAGDSGHHVKPRRAVLSISRELDRLGGEDLPQRLIGLYCGGGGIYPSSTSTHNLQ